MKGAAGTAGGLVRAEGAWPPLLAQRQGKVPPIVTAWSSAPLSAASTRGRDT